MVTVLDGNYVEVADGEGNVLASLYIEPYFMPADEAPGAPFFDTRVLELNSTVIDLAVDFWDLTWTVSGGGGAPALNATLKPGDELTVLACSDRGAWRSGSTYLITITYKDANTGQILTKTVAVEG